MSSATPTSDFDAIGLKRGGLTSLWPVYYHRPVAEVTGFGLGFGRERREGEENAKRERGEGEGFPQEPSHSKNVRHGRRGIGIANQSIVLQQWVNVEAANKDNVHRRYY